VGAWREFISWVQVQVLFERIPRGRATRLREHLAGKSGNVSRCTKCPHDIWNYFLCELQRVRERKNDIHDEYAPSNAKHDSYTDDEDEKLQEVLEV
jgi:hypothetical protein